MLQEIAILDRSTQEFIQFRISFQSSSSISPFLPSEFFKNGAFPGYTKTYKLRNFFTSLTPSSWLTLTKVTATV